MVEQASLKRFEPRDWQKQCADQCVALARSGADRALLYACPGSGKTFGGLLTALQLRDRVKKTQTIIVITPSLAIKTQWIERACLMGIELREIVSPKDLQQRELPFGTHGYILSYQQAINCKRSLRTFCEIHNPIVILDEVHHTSGAGEDRDGNAWGEAVERAFAPASFKLCTTGTPFREGSNPIAFVHYNEAGEATAAFRYTYEQAIRDGICRPIEFEFYDGEISWESRGGVIVTADFTDKLSKKKSRERLEAALSTDGQFPLRMLEAAASKLSAMRVNAVGDSKPAGLVVAIDVAHANTIADALHELTGERPVVVHNKIDEAQALIDEFRDGDASWIVGINMLSEGVDIPRLRVGVFASRIRTPLYFHQFCGRFTRVQADRSERSFVYLPRDPELEAIAIEIEKEKYHALGEEPRIGRGGGVGGRGRRREIAVEESDGRAVGKMFAGMFFPQAYIADHSGLIAAFKAKNPGQHDVPDVEVLKWLIDVERIAPPASEAA